MIARSDSRVFLPVLALLIVGAWAALAAWGASPAGYLLDHQALGHRDISLEVSFLATTAAFVAGWNLMVIAMMLPTILPLLGMLRAVAGPARTASVTTAAATGYVAVWSAFGTTAHAVDYGIHRAVASHGWLHANEWAIGVAPLLVAGAYQLTPLKLACLDRCRSPFSFVAARWNGSNPRTQALHIGVEHGLFCLGCCWALMLLMFAVSVGNLAWMLLLAAVMGIEKNHPRGHQLTMPAGIVLLSAAVTLVVLNV